MATIATTDERIAHIEQMLQSLIEPNNSNAPAKNGSNVLTRIDATFAEIDRVRESIAASRERSRKLAEETRANFSQIDAVLTQLTVTK